MQKRDESILAFPVKVDKKSKTIIKYPYRKASKEEYKNFINSEDYKILITGIEMLDIISNETRRLILWLLKYSPDGISITNLTNSVNQLRKDVGLETQDWKAIEYHVKRLEKASLIKLEKKKNLRGKPNIITMEKPVLDINILIGKTKFPLFY